MIKAIIIDDETNNQELISNLLSSYAENIQVVSIADSVESGFQAITEHQPDLVFLDIQMGEQTGFDVLKLLPKRNFEVIFITAYDQYGIQAVKFAALDYLLKPIDIEELINAVNKAGNKLAAQIQNLQLDFLLQQLKM